MLASSCKQKGKRLEDYVVDYLKEFDEYIYRRKDSGSGLHNKEDVTTKLPFHIECKNQEATNIKKWWLQTCDGCPVNKYPVLVYKKNYQREPIVYMMLSDLMSYMSDIKVETFKIGISMVFSDFTSLIKEKCKSQ